MSGLRALSDLLRVIWLPVAVYLGWRRRREWRAGRNDRLRAEIDAANERINEMDQAVAGPGRQGPAPIASHDQGSEGHA